MASKQDQGREICRRSGTYFSSLSFLSLSLFFFLCLRFFCFLLYLSFLSLSLSFLFCLCFVVALCLFVTVCALSVSVTFIPQLLPHLRRQHPLSSSLPSRQPTPFGSSCIDFGLITGQSMFWLEEKKCNLEECESTLLLKKGCKPWARLPSAESGWPSPPPRMSPSLLFLLPSPNRFYFIFWFMGKLTRKI